MALFALSVTSVTCAWPRIGPESRWQWGSLTRQLQRRPLPYLSSLPYVMGPASQGYCGFALRAGDHEKDTGF